MTFFGAALALAWIMIILLAFAMAAILRQVRELTGETPDGLASISLPLGSRSPLPATGRRQVILLASFDCPTCAEILPNFGAAGRDDPPDIDLVVLYPNAGGHPRHSELAQPGPAARARVVHDTTAFDAFAPRWTPTVVAVDASGAVIDAQPAGSVERVRAFVGAHGRDADAIVARPTSGDIR